MEDTTVNRTNVESQARELGLGMVVVIGFIPKMNTAGTEWVKSETICNLPPARGTTYDSGPSIGSDGAPRPRARSTKGTASTSIAAATRYEAA